jgi:hypothetical protein
MAKPFTLTYQDKILLHLLRFVGMEERYQVVREVTQEDIATCVGIQRKHLPRTLKNMKGKGLLVERRAHVKGVKQIRRVYFLTWKGEVLANKLKEDLSSVKIVYKKGRQKVNSTVGEVVNLLGISYSLLEILEAIEDDGVLDLTEIKKQKKGKSKGTTISTYEKKISIYRETLEKAWIDGKITLNERIILDHLRQELGIPLKDHDRLEAETVSKIPLIHQERLDIYKIALAVSLRNLEISKEEQMMLEALRENMKISVIEHEELKKEILRDTKLIKDMSSGRKK